MKPTLLILTLSTAAALTSALGVLPLVGRRRVPTRWIGLGNAIAAGMMLGAAYMLSALEGSTASTGSAQPGVFEAIGAILGIVFIYWTHVAVGTEGLELNRSRADDPIHGYRILMVNGLHSGSEGMAMAVAMVIDVRFGVLVAGALAVHNIPEATVLAAVLRGRGLSLGQITGLAMATNVSQPLLAVAAYSVVTAAPAALPWVLGFAIGALVQLVLVELLPESYREAGQGSIALVTVVALGVVVLIQGLVG
ncbi:MAG: ZIP family metal transporter [Thermoanaerobaculia bacterium]